MALIDELQAATDVWWLNQGKVTDIYFKSHPLLAKLGIPEMGKGTDLVDGGRTINVELEMDELPGGSFNNTTKFSTERKNVLTNAAFPWAAYYSAIVYDLDDKRQNNGKAAIAKIIDTKLRNGQKTVRKKLAAGIHGAATTSGKDLLGLDDLFNTTTSTAYGGIAEDDLSAWSANTDATSEAIGMTSLQRLRRLASIDDNAEGHPDLYVTTELLKDGFERSLQSQARYSDERMVNAGFDNILFGGAAVVYDNGQAAGTCDALNTRYLYLKTHRDFNFTKPEWSHAVNEPNTMVGYIQWSGQLITSNRKAHGRHTALTEPA